MSTIIHITYNDDSRDIIENIKEYDTGRGNVVFYCYAVVKINGKREFTSIVIPHRNIKKIVATEVL